MGSSQTPVIATASASTAAEELQDYLDDLWLPADFISRGAEDSAGVSTLQANYATWIDKRPFYLGLMFAFVGFVEGVLAESDSASLPDALAKYPPQTMGPKGPLRTLTVVVGKKKVSLRGRVNRIETLVFGPLKRSSYPSAAPHISWAWREHLDELNALFAMSPQERTKFAQFLWGKVVALARPTTLPRVAPSRPFATLLRKFDRKAYPGERTGAALQAMVYAYVRADSPNVTVESSRVRSGSSRHHAVGDVDGWYGAELVLTYEVRDLDIVDIKGLGPFIRNLSGHTDPTAVVVARTFSATAKGDLAREFILPRTIDELAASAEVWDIRKQEEAMRHFEHYIRHIEQSDSLDGRFEQFLKDEAIELP